MGLNLSPVDFGLPSKFSDWRDGQLSALDQIINSPERFQAVCAPTGFGKSLTYYAAAKISELRTCVLTSTKGLQDQLRADFASISTDIRGMANYRCPIAKEQFGMAPTLTVADAPCQCGYGCKLRIGGCEYYDVRREAEMADIIVTNYQCWMYDQRRREGLDSIRKIDMLVLDEAHDAPEELASYLGTELSRKECESAGIDWPQSGYDQGQWQQWGEYWYVRAVGWIEQLEGEVKLHTTKGKDKAAWAEIRELKKVVKKLGRVMDMKEDWVVEEQKSEKGRTTGVHFNPLWPRLYAESELFRGVRKVVLVSATVRPKTAELLGIASQDLGFQEYQSNFPLAYRPVIHVPCVRMRFGMPQTELTQWMTTIDALLKVRSDRKGIIHTVSYKRARELVAASQFRSRMMVHGSNDRDVTVAKFKAAPPGAILVSPSVDTGYDFPYDQCEYQIVGKLPFPDTRSTVVTERCKTDKDYRNYMTAQVLVQMAGRGMRSEDDRCETLIVDDQIKWFRYQAEAYLPKWFRAAMKTSIGLPRPLAKL